MITSTPQMLRVSASRVDVSYGGVISAENLLAAAKCRGKCNPPSPILLNTCYEVLCIA